MSVCQPMLLFVPETNAVISGWVGHDDVAVGEDDGVSEVEELLEDGLGDGEGDG